MTTAFEGIFGVLLRTFQEQVVVAPITANIALQAKCKTLPIRTMKQSIFICEKRSLAVIFCYLTNWEISGVIFLIE